MALITVNLLKAVGASNANAALYAPLLENARIVPNDDFSTISSKNGIAMLIAQTALESGYFNRLEENLNYTVEALRGGSMRKYFTQAEANTYGAVKDIHGNYIKRANERMIANLFYGGRLGNRGVLSDDGWDYRGSGLIQNTGLSNHKAFAKSIGKSVLEATAYSRTPEGGVTVALWYWRSNGLLIPASRGDVSRCTQIIQGADGHLVSRIELYKAALTALN